MLAVFCRRQRMALIAAICLFPMLPRCLQNGIKAVVAVRAHGERRGLTVHLDMLHGIYQRASLLQGYCATLGLDVYAVSMRCREARAFETFRDRESLDMHLERVSSATDRELSSPACTFSSL